MTFKLSEIGLVPVDWEISELKTKATITMGQSPKSDSYNSECIGMPFMQGRKTFGDKYHSIDTWCTDPKKIAKRNDVLISVRAPVGDVNVATTDLCIGRGLASLRMHNGNNEFLYYLLKNYSKEITNRETGTVFASINKKGLETIKLPFPSDIEQKAIANILSTLDEKIETNNQINEKLEEMAQALFKHWFVDFEFPNENGEPYKSSGGEMVESELGMIPKGWKVSKLSELITLYDSKRIPLSKNERDKREKIYPYYGASSLMDYVDDYIFDGVYVLLGEDGTVIDELGYPILQYVWGKFWVNNHAHVIKGKNDYSEEFVYMLLKNTNVSSAVTGAVQLKINQKNLKNLSVVIPEDTDLIKQFSGTLNYQFSIIRNNSDQNKVLTSIRDNLLPKLMSGEIRVPLDDEVLSEQN
jgi:type I restriction enzyme S subunit